jgi:serine/threonine protein kinase
MNKNEFKIMKELSDRGLSGFPKVYDSGCFQNQPYIVSERLGLSIKDILKRNRKHFSVKCIMTIGLQLVDLLEKLHEVGYIHCDLKPDNVMVGNYILDPKAMNELYLIDFGIS